MKLHAFILTLLHSEWPKLHRVLAVQSAPGLNLMSDSCQTVDIRQVSDVISDGWQKLLDSDK